MFLCTGGVQQCLNLNILLPFPAHERILDYAAFIKYLTVTDGGWTVSLAP